MFTAAERHNNLKQPLHTTAWSFKVHAMSGTGPPCVTSSILSQKGHGVQRYLAISAIQGHVRQSLSCDNGKPDAMLYCWHVLAPCWSCASARPCCCSPYALEVEQMSAWERKGVQLAEETHTCSAVASWLCSTRRPQQALPRGCPL